MTSPLPSDAADLYLDLIKRCLTRYGIGDRYRPIDPRRGLKSRLYRPFKRMLNSQSLELTRVLPFDADARAEGLDHPPEAETMVGLRRLDSLQECVREVLAQEVPGDLIETGIWRGGTAIFMRALLAVYGDTVRVVWAADSFQGVPKPDSARYPADAGDTNWRNEKLAVSLDEVRANFARYRLLDDQVRFLPGLFSATLPTAPIERLAVLRLDGDLYQSTMDALTALYPKVSAGGYVIVDDYGNEALGCRQAVDDYRAASRISEPMQRVDWTCSLWRVAAPLEALRAG